MMIDQSVKRKVIRDWSEEFTALSVFSQNKLYKKVTPFIIGLELFKISGMDAYRPIFVSYPLWRTDVKECLDHPFFLQQIYDKKGLQFDVLYAKHSVLFQEAVACVERQASVLSQQDIVFSRFLEVLDSQFSYALVKLSPVAQAWLLEAKLFAALYVDDFKVIERVFKEIDTMSKGWPPGSFEWRYGKLEDWIHSLRIRVSERDEFLKQLAVNEADKKIAKLKSSKLVADSMGSVLESQRKNGHLKNS